MGFQNAHRDDDGHLQAVMDLLKSRGCDAMVVFTTPHSTSLALSEACIARIQQDNKNQVGQALEMCSFAMSSILLKCSEVSCKPGIPNTASVGVIFQALEGALAIASKQLSNVIPR